MTAWRLAAWLVGIFFAGLLGGCTIMSQNPVSPESAAIVDPALWGAWHAEDNQGTYLLQVAPRDRADGRLLEIRLEMEAKKEKGTVWHAFEGHVTELSNGVCYLSLRLVDSRTLADIDKMYPERASYPYSFVWYGIVRDNFLYTSQPAAEIREAVRSGRLAGKSEGKVVPIVSLTDSSENIARFLAALDYSHSEQFTFTRVKPAP